MLRRSLSRHWINVSQITVDMSAWVYTYSTFSQTFSVAKNTSIVDRACYQKLQAHVSENSKTYPLQIGAEYSEEERNQMAEYLLRKHFSDFKSTHCTPLPIEHFQIPWDLPSTESGFIFT